MYSDDADLPSSNLKNHVSPEVKQERFDRLMSRQVEISREVNRQYVGKTLKVLVEGCAAGADDFLSGRTSFQSPEIDGVVFVHEGAADPGAFVDVLISEAHEYDLRGTIV
jgi:ribosomal protein S12 methylthiotransferase